MNHVSGYPDYYPLDFVDRRMQQPIAVDEVIRQYGTAKLDFETGRLLSRKPKQRCGFTRGIARPPGEKENHAGLDSLASEMA